MDSVNQLIKNDIKVFFRKQNQNRSFGLNKTEPTLKFPYRLSKFPEWQHAKSWQKLLQINFKMSLILEICSLFYQFHKISILVYRTKNGPRYTKADCGFYQTFFVTLLYMYNCRSAILSWLSIRFVTNHGSLTHWSKIKY